MSSAVRVWYTADLHIGHRKVAEIRGFLDEDFVIEGEDENGDWIAVAGADTAEHDKVLAANWDAVVGPNDIVYVLGDVAVSGFPYALQWISERPGIKHLVTGNHDPVHPMRTDSIKLQRQWLAAFDSVQPFLRRKLLGKTVLLSHFPYEGDHTETDRETQYRLRDEGMLLLHGHTHGREVGHGSMYHVGLDAHNLQLVSQSTILEWVASKLDDRS